MPRTKSKTTAPATPTDPDFARLEEFRTYRPSRIFDLGGRLDMMTSAPIREGKARVERLGPIRKHWDLARVTIVCADAHDQARFARELGLLARTEMAPGAALPSLVLLGPVEVDDDDDE